MERRRISETEHKLVILHTLELLGPVTGMQLIQFLAEKDLMNYFTMHLNLSEMEEQGQIQRRAHPLGSLLEPTDEGLFTLRSFIRRIPGSRRRLIEADADAWRERFRAEQMTLSEVMAREGDRLTLRLRLLEGPAVLMDLILADCDVPEAYLSRRWQLAAQGVYQHITSALMAGFAPDAPVPQGAHPALQQASRAEWLLTLQDASDNPRMTLLLTLPDEHLARWCLSRWDELASALRDHTAAMLRAVRV
ncbi:MAG: DUF4364 family protein [Clostridia bacterium]|nr:DUF4364 family protein [Clostridia bacterium]